MTAQFWNFGTEVSAKTLQQKKYIKPQEVLQDPYLTSFQKRMVLEAMLMEAKDSQSEDGGSRQCLKFIEEIMKIKMKLQGQMD